MFKSKSFVTVFAFFLFVCFLSTTYAQRQTGSLKGNVTDEDGNPLPGVSLTISSPALLGTHDFTTTTTGDFRFIALSPGTYTITAELSGFKTLTRGDLIISVGKTTTITITMDPSAIEEEVTVTATAPIVDVKSSKIALTYTKELLDNIPMNRSLTTIINAAPGVITGMNSSSNSSVHGAVMTGNIYSLDGLNTTDPLIGTPQAIPDFSMVEEVEMELGAHPAEVGSASGGYINIVTRSGGNELHGQGTLYYYDESFVDNNFSQEQLDSLGISTASKTKSTNDFSLSLGGPVIKDRLWFFGAGRYYKATSSVLDFPLDVWSRSLYGLGKLTLLITKNIKLMGYYNFRDYKEPYGSASRYYTPEATYIATSKIKNFNTRLNWILGSNAFLDVRGMYVDAMSHLHQQDGATYHDADQVTGMNTGAWRWEEYGGRRRLLASAALTLFADNLLGGNHEVKVGAEIDSTKFYNSNWAKVPLQTYSFNGSPYMFDNVGQILAWGFGPNEGDGECLNTAVSYNFYIQDAWTIKNRLTFNLGVRFDSSHATIPAQFAAEVPYWQWLDPVWYGKQEYPEIKDILVFNDFSPRLGLVYDVFGNGKTTFRASYSRYRDYLALTMFSQANPNSYAMKVFLWFDNNFNTEIDPADFFLNVYTMGRESADARDFFDPDAYAPFWNEFIVGIEHEILPNFKVGVSYIYKAQNNVYEQIEMNRDLNWASQFTVNDPGYDGLYGTTDDQQLTVWDRSRPQEHSYYTNLEEAWRRYQALEFIFEKRMSNRWQFIGSLVYSKNWGTIGGSYMPSLHFSGAFDTPNYMINREGRLDFDRPFVLKLQGTYQLPYGINFSGYFIHSSGVPLTRNVDVWLPNAGMYTNINTEPQASRREPSWNRLDLRIEKEVAFGNFARLGFFVDVYNALNNANIYTQSSYHGLIEADGSFTQLSSWQTVSSVSNPRYVKLGVRFTF